MSQVIYKNVIKCLFCGLVCPDFVFLHRHQYHWHPK